MFCFCEWRPFKKYRQHVECRWRYSSFVSKIMDKMISQQNISEYNSIKAKEHSHSLQFLGDILTKKGIKIKSIIENIKGFEIAIPSWALGTGGTRFGRFPIGGEPR